MNKELILKQIGEYEIVIDRKENLKDGVEILAEGNPAECDNIDFLDSILDSRKKGCRCYFPFDDKKLTLHPNSLISFRCIITNLQKPKEIVIFKRKIITDGKDNH